MYGETEGPSFGRGWGGGSSRQQSVEELAMSLWTSTFYNVLASAAGTTTTQAINAANQAVAAFRETFKQENN